MLRRGQERVSEQKSNLRKLMASSVCLRMKHTACPVSRGAGLSIASHPWSSVGIGTIESLKVNCTPSEKSLRRYRT